MCIASPTYERRQPEQTQLYWIIADHWQTFLQERFFEGRDVPKFIRQEFEGFLRCGILACGFGRVCCPSCVIQSNPTTDSNRKRPPIPTESDH
jgi:hypothetical protein